MSGNGRERGWGVALALTAGLALAALVPAAHGDEIVFKNGDRITGTIKTADGGQMTISTPNLGDVTVDMKNVSTFATDEPISLQMEDGTVIHQKVNVGQDGQVITAPGGTIAPQPIPLAKVQKINPPPVLWTGSLVINGMLARANTSSEQLGIALQAVRRSDIDRISADAGYVYGQQKVNGVTTVTEDNWFLDGKYDYFLSKQFYANAFGRVEKDRILDLDLRLTPGAGVGYQWFEREDLNLDTEAGVAWVYEDFTTLPSPREQVSLRGAYHVDATFLDAKLRLFNDVQVFPSVQSVRNFLFIGDVGGRVMLTHTMFSELKAELDYDSEPAPGSSRTSTKYTLGVGWTF